MGELHLQIYVERMKRAYSVDVETGAPQVNYRETIRQRSEFDYFHKKQTGGVFGSIRACACSKGVNDAIQKGWLIGHPVQRMRVVVNDGQSHSVDSSELAFRTATVLSIRQAFMKANPCILEPVMAVEVELPNEFQGRVRDGVHKTHGIVGRDMQEKLMNEHEKAQAAKNK
ncbi:unnamed protein product [Hyaloperonospora brassicae]|uniref:Translation elongation factor EFG/EF2 domain-containing protein n=1 Tax=Hyaloperonospora brassicae TaxID=162125 RepID=A0AAV0TBD6_HYABA|nr:unnamed protein product [Hyaloperonospora brassicae]